MAKNRANLNQAHNSGATPVYIAAREGHTQVVEILIQNGANLNHVLKHGETAVFIAAYKGHAQVIEILAKNGAELNQALHNGATPVFIAAQLGHTNIVDLLCLKGANINPFCNYTRDKLRSFSKNDALISERIEHFINSQSDKLNLLSFDIAGIMGHKEILNRLFNHAVENNDTFLMDYMLASRVARASPT